MLLRFRITIHYQCRSSQAAGSTTCASSAPDAGGGMAAKVLTEGGRRRRHAGSRPDVGSASRMPTCSSGPMTSPRRARRPGKQQFGEFDAASGGWTLDGEPYTRAPGSTFDWFRARMLGGRTNHWGRISLRFGPDDFRRKSLDGLGDDWPITYDDAQAVLRPGRQVCRDLRDQLSKRAAQRARRHLHAAAEAALLRAADQAGSRQARHHCVPSRMSIITQAAQRPDRLSLLRPVQPRLFDALELLVAVRADSAGARDQAPDDLDQRDGARSHDRRRTAWRRASPTSTRTPAARITSARASSSSRPAPASRRASC